VNVHGPTPHKLVEPPSVVIVIVCGPRGASGAIVTLKPEEGGPIVKPLPLNETDVTVDRFVPRSCTFTVAPWVPPEWLMELTTGGEEPA
jgi:hypothetical protein